MEDLAEFGQRLVAEHPALVTRARAGELVALTAAEVPEVAEAAARAGYDEAVQAFLVAVPLPAAGPAPGDGAMTFYVYDQWVGQVLTQFPAVDGATPLMVPVDPEAPAATLPWDVDPTHQLLIWPNRDLVPGAERLPRLVSSAATLDQVTPALIERLRDQLKLGAVVVLAAAFSDADGQPYLLLFV